jgi:mono/diheme cytochrome c family protein
VDPDVTPGKSDALTPQDHSSLPSLAKELEKDESARGKFAAQLDGVPDRAHWVVTDITDAPGDWYPRRSDWASVLVDQKLDGVDAVQKKVVGILQSVTLSEAFRSYAVAPVPFGIWQKKDGCDLSSVPKVSSLTGDARPAWFDRKVPPLASDDPVYVQSPGGMVFNEICINCHGPKFDSRGRQADTLMLMTGGDTRVANLRDGLLGPVMMPGANRQRVFGERASASVKADDWAARYVAWMGLGGTQRIIPLSILSLVGTTQVLGEVRPYPVTAESANMLSIAQTLCAQTLGRDTRPDFFDVDTGSIIYAGTSLSLIGDNGDAEQWTKLCGFENPPPVRIVSLFSSGFQIENLADITSGTSSWYKAATYPSSAPVGDQRGKIAKGIQPGNLAPWCVMAPADSATQTQLDEAQKKRSASQGPLPICPDTWLTVANKIDQAAFDSWSLRAAMNAGFSVFLYLDQLSRDALSGKAAPVAFDHCEQLKP